MSSPDPAPASAAQRVERCLQAVSEHNGLLKALNAVDAEGARRQSSNQGGQVVAVKDNIDVAGLPCTAGSRFFADRVAEGDAACIGRLRGAAGIVIGKANLHEFAFGGTTQNPHLGGCRNPWGTDRIPGGSSGGSAAAAAAGMCEAALGTDTGGSVRIPAAFCGLVGLRPTPGRISNRGAFPISPRFDTIGPMARTARAAQTLYRAIAGHDPSDPDSVDRPVETWDGDPLRGATIGLPTTYFFDDVEPDVASGVEAAVGVLAQLGAAIQSVAVAGADEAHNTMDSVIRADAFALHKERLATQPLLFGADVLERLRLGEGTTPAQYKTGLDACDRWREHVAALFEDVDFILTPTVGCTAPPIVAPGTTTTRTHRLTRMTFVWSFSQTPAISIPCGFSEAGLPIGLQLVGRPWSEARLLAAAEAYQAVTDHHLRRPAPGARP